MTEKRIERLIHGDCVEIMSRMKANRIDAIVCDPPYGLEFMGKDWDKLTRVGWQGTGGFTKPGIGDRQIKWPSFSATAQFGTTNPTCANCGGRLRGSKKCKCEKPVWKPIGKRRYKENEALPDDATSAGMGRQMSAMQEWHATWAAEALRVLKPGGHLLAFGGTRTFHRLACGLEDAGFEIRDCVMWLYGNGFPKSRNISKDIDKAAGAEREIIGPSKRHSSGRKGNTNSSNPNLARYSQDDILTAPATEDAIRWQGWGTALKPGWEPCIIARKPLVGTVAANVQKYGTGALNIDASRIEGDTGDGHWSGDDGSDETSRPGYDGGFTRGGRKVRMQRQHVDSAGMKRLGGGGFRADHEQPMYNPAGRWPANVILMHDARCGMQPVGLFGDEQFVCHEDCPIAMLDMQAGTRNSGTLLQKHRGGDKTRGIYGSFKSNTGPDYEANSGSASRFYYVPKASRSERSAQGWIDNKHPTVKPVDLMAYLIKLVTPTGGVVLDPFMGSGSTLVAARRSGYQFVGIEQDEESYETARKRVFGVLHDDE